MSCAFNCVLIWSRNSFEYFTVPPTAVRVGHLVELQVLFNVVPRGKRGHLMLNKLCSVCIVDRSAEEVRAGRDMRGFLISNRGGSVRTHIASGCNSSPVGATQLCGR